MNTCTNTIYEKSIYEEFPLTKTIKVVVYGMGVNFEKAINYILLRFTVVGCSDRDEKKVSVSEKYGMKFYYPYSIQNCDYDYVIVTSVYGDEIKNDLISYGVPTQKILLMAEWQKMDFFHTFGDKNPDKLFYLISKPIRAGNGLISLLYMYLDLLRGIEGSNIIPVIDLQTYKNQYLADDEVGKVNAWEKFFEQLSDYKLEDVLQSKNVILAHDDAGYLNNYKDDYPIEELSRVYKKYISFKPDVVQYIEQQARSTINGEKNVLGVLYRGTDMNSLKLKKHMIQPSLDEVYREVCLFQKKYGCKKIFLSTEDEKALIFFKNKFGNNLIYTNQKRYDELGSNWISEVKNDRENDSYLRGVEYLTTIKLLSECDYLVSGVVAGSIGALIMNDGHYKDICLIDKGYY